MGDNDNTARAPAAISRLPDCMLPLLLPRTQGPREQLLEPAVVSRLVQLLGSAAVSVVVSIIGWRPMIDLWGSTGALNPLISAQVGCAAAGRCVRGCCAPRGPCILCQRNALLCVRAVLEAAPLHAAPLPGPQPDMPWPECFTSNVWLTSTCGGSGRLGISRF